MTTGPHGRTYTSQPKDRNEKEDLQNRRARIPLSLKTKR